MAFASTLCNAWEMNFTPCRWLPFNSRSASKAGREADTDSRSNWSTSTKLNTPSPYTPERIAAASSAGIDFATQDSPDHSRTQKREFVRTTFQPTAVARRIEFGLSIATVQ